MWMVRRIVLGVSIFILAGCAQIGTLSGGEMDEVAPQIIKQDIEQGSINFHGNSITLEFDEYFKLNNPSQNITIIPNDAKINATYKKKVLNLSWEEQLRENTTYIIQMNHLVQDITEANDSLMQIVFSTGPMIDSMTYSCSVKDVKGINLSKSLVVGLFTHQDSLNPIYYTNIKKDGTAELEYIKEGTYYVRAFNDENKNLSIDVNETVGFKDNTVNLNETDSVPLVLFQPLAKPQITKTTFITPGIFRIGANRTLLVSNFELDGDKIPEEDLRTITPDSILFHAIIDTVGYHFVSVNSTELSDTVKVRISKNALNVQPLVIENENSTISAGRDAVFSTTDKIKTIYPGLIHGYTLADSSAVDLIIKNELDQFFVSYSDTVEKIRIVIDSNAIIGVSNWKNKAAEFIISKKQFSQLGTLNVNLDHYTQKILLEVYRSNKLQGTYSSSGETVKLEYLEPGDYSFKVVLDKNNNGRWDTGNFELKIQPEEIHTFTEATKVRANWEVDVELIPSSANGE